MGKGGEVTYMARVYKRRLVISISAIAALLVILVWQYSVFVITLGLGWSVMLVAAFYTTAAFGLSWGIRGAWKSNRDTMYHEMGKHELLKYLASIEQAIADREEGDD